MLTLRHFPLRTVGAAGANTCARTISFPAAEVGRKSQDLYTWVLELPGGRSRIDRCSSAADASLVISAAANSQTLRTEQWRRSAGPEQRSKQSDSPRTAVQLRAS